MPKRLISVVLAVVLALGCCLPAAAAAAQGIATVGAARADGEYTLSFRSEGSCKDLEHSYYYSESFFDTPATSYNHELATASLGLALAAFNTAASDAHYWEDGEVGREASIAAAYGTLGFANAKFYNYDINLNTYADYAAYSIAQKTVTVNGKTRTVIALVLRGGGYGSEWASNVELGSGAQHEGFTSAAESVFASLQSYIAAARKRGKVGEIKLWICGYSRGGAVANLLAARIAHRMPEIKQADTYVYTFAAPAVMTSDGSSEWKADYDNNHTSSGTLKAAWTASNIHNIIGSGDIVPQVPPADWGYYRNGNDRFLPLPRTDEEKAALNALAKEINPDDLVDFASLAGQEEVKTLVTTLENVFGGREGYSATYQSVMMDMLQCAFQRSEDEVVLGVVLGNEEIFQRLHSLSNMDKFTWGNIVTSVWLASATSRPLLERFGDNVPLRMQQIVIPLLATGLCYGIEKDALQVLAQFIMDMVASESVPAQAVNVFKGHYPEVYLALMEYYGPETHTMQAATRS